MKSETFYKCVQTIIKLHELETGGKWDALKFGQLEEQQESEWNELKEDSESDKLIEFQMALTKLDDTWVSVPGVQDARQSKDWEKVVELVIAVAA